MSLRAFGIVAPDSWLIGLLTSFPEAARQTSLQFLLAQRPGYPAPVDLPSTPCVLMIVMLGGPRRRPPAEPTINLYIIVKVESRL